MKSKAVLSGRKTPCLWEGEMASVRDTCEQRQESRRQNRRQLCKNSCQSEMMDWQGSVCVHAHTRWGAAWSDSIAVVSADKSFWRVINVCIPSSTTSCLQTEEFQVLPLKRPRTAVYIRLCPRIAQAAAWDSVINQEKASSLQSRFATSREQS